MGIIACPECKGQLSDLAPACPHCGYVTKPPPAQAKPSFILKMLDTYLKPDVARFWRECKRSFGVLALIMLGAMMLGVIIGASLSRENQIEVIKLILDAIGGQTNTGSGRLRDRVRFCVTK